MLDLALILALSETCAPAVAPRTMAAVAYAESRFNPFAIGVNGSVALRRQPKTRLEAVGIARELIAGGPSIDLGLAQINSANLGWLNLTIEEAFEPCRNLAAASVVLLHGYRPLSSAPTDRQAALRAALSRYNTGHPERGFRNGYVARVEAAAGTLGLAQVPRASHPQAPVAAAKSPVEQSPVASWDVFGRAQASARLVFASTGNASGGQK